MKPTGRSSPPNLPGRRGMKDKQKARRQLHSVPDVSKDLPELSQPLSGSLFYGEGRKQSLWAPVDHVLFGTQWKAVAGERVMSHTTATLRREEEGCSASLLPIATLTLSPCSPWQLTLRLSSIPAVSFPSLCAVCLSLVLPGSLCHSWIMVLNKTAFV